jgi:hypothetical protein
MISGGGYILHTGMIAGSLDLVCLKLASTSSQRHAKIKEHCGRVAAAVNLWPRAVISSGPLPPHHRRAAYLVHPLELRFLPCWSHYPLQSHTTHPPLYAARPNICMPRRRSPSRVPSAATAAKPGSAASLASCLRMSASHARHGAAKHASSC